MEKNNPNSLATDSFSYSWLAHPTRTHETDSPARHKTDDPRLAHTNFSFDVSVSADHDHHNHADRLFSNGHLMPAFPSATPSAHNTLPTTTSTSNQVDSTTFSSRPSFEASVSASLIRHHHHHQQSIFRRKLSRFSRKLLHKYLGFLMLPWCPIGARPRSRRRCKRVDDLERRAHEVKSLGNTPETVSPRLSTASAYSNWSDYADTSIYEAILYCKKSSEQ